MTSKIHCSYLNRWFHIWGGGYLTSNWRGGAPKSFLLSTGSGIFVENVYPVSEFSFTYVLKPEFGKNSATLTTLLTWKRDLERKLSNMIWCEAKLFVNSGQSLLRTYLRNLAATRSLLLKRVTLNRDESCMAQYESTPPPAQNPISYSGEGGENLEMLDKVPYYIFWWKSAIGEMFRKATLLTKSV